MRGWSICFFINLFVYFHAESQHVFKAVPSFKKEIVYDTSKNAHNSVIHFTGNSSDVNYSFNSTIKPVPSGFYFNFLGFFCQKELQMEKVTKFPIKFRLGSVAYTDQMEGKGTR